MASKCAKSVPVVTVYYHTFGGSVRKVAHWYALLDYDMDGVNYSVELTHVLTAIEAERLNVQDQHVSYKEGDKSERFFTLEELKQRAEERAAELFPDGFKMKYELTRW